MHILSVYCCVHSSTLHESVKSCICVSALESNILLMYNKISALLIIKFAGCPFICAAVPVSQAEWGRSCSGQSQLLQSRRRQILLEQERSVLCLIGSTQLSFFSTSLCPLHFVYVLVHCVCMYTICTSVYTCTSLLSPIAPPCILED